MKVALRRISEDNLNYFSDKEIKKIINSEDIMYTGNVIKINKTEEEQNIIILTNEKLYNLRPKKILKSKIPILTISGITTSSQSDEFIIHYSTELENDYHYKSEKKRKIIQIISMLYYSLHYKKIKLSLINESNLLNYVTLKNEKKKNLSFSRQNIQNLIDIDLFLYGNIKKKKNQNQKWKFSQVATTMKSIKTEIIYFDPTPFTDCNLKELKIENFRALGILCNSIYGQVFLCEFIPNGSYYFMRCYNSNKIDSYMIKIEKIYEFFLMNNYPFLPKIDFFIQTEEKVYLANLFSPECEGGYLFNHLNKKKIFDEETTKFYSSQIAILINYFHTNQINYMGFSPENFILDSYGYIKYLNGEIDSILAQENNILVLNKPYEYDIVKDDWYNLGVIIYEMLFNIKPYYGYDNILKFPSLISVSDNAKNLLKNLLTKNDNLRINNFEDLKKSDFFKDVNFDDILNKKVTPNIIPIEINNNLNNTYIADEQKDKENYNVSNFEMLDDDYDDEEENKN